MARHQKGILAEANLHSLYLMFNAVDGCETAILSALKQLSPILNQLDEDYSESELSAFVAIGAHYWDQLFSDSRPVQLENFPLLKTDKHVAPSTPYDLFVHIRSDRADVNHITGTQICHLFGTHVRLVEQVKGFRFLDGRDLTGFVDGTENPHGRRRREVALVAQGDDAPEFTGGSYIHIQRYKHKLDLWNRLPVQSQETIIGRTKVDNVEFPSAEKASFAHTKRTNLKDHHGQPIEMLRQSMPYGTMKMQGLFFVSCAARGDVFTKMLTSMLGIHDSESQGANQNDSQKHEPKHEQKHEKNGDYDHLMDYTQAETGAAFFAPSLDFLNNIELSS